MCSSKKEEIKMSNIIVVVALLSFLTITDGMSPGEQGVNLRCQCISMERRPIGRHIEKMEIIPANSHCEETQIIVTLKKTGTKVCLNPEAKWVKRILQKIKRQQNARKHHTTTDSAHK